MRRLLVVFLVCLAAAAAPAAAPGTTLMTGTGWVELQYGVGRATLFSRGSLLGAVRRGRVVATRNVTVSGWERRARLPSGLIEYRGAGLRLYATGSPWRVTMAGRGINASGRVAGALALRGDAGRFRIGIYGRWRPWPSTLRTFRLGTG